MRGLFGKKKTGIPSHLPAGETACLEGGRPVALRCESGVCWVTQAGDPRDHVLRPGGVFRSSRRGLVVAWALTDARLQSAA